MKNLIFTTILLKIFSSTLLLPERSISKDVFTKYNESVIERETDIREFISSLRQSEREDFLLNPDSPIYYEDLEFNRKFVNSCQNFLRSAEKNGYRQVDSIKFSAVHQWASSNPTIRRSKEYKLNRGTGLSSTAGCNSKSNGKKDPWILINEIPKEDFLGPLCFHEFLCSQGVHDSHYALTLKVDWMGRKGAHASSNPLDKNIVSTPVLSLKREKNIEIAALEESSDDLECNAEMLCHGGTKVGGGGNYDSYRLKKIGISHLSKMAAMGINSIPYGQGRSLDLAAALKIALNCPVHVTDDLKSYLPFIHGETLTDMQDGLFFQNREVNLGMVISKNLLTTIEIAQLYYETLKISPTHQWNEILSGSPLSEAMKSYVLQISQFKEQNLVGNLFATTLIPNIAEKHLSENGLSLEKPCH